MYRLYDNILSNVLKMAGAAIIGGGLGWSWWSHMEANYGPDVYP